MWGYDMMGGGGAGLMTLSGFVWLIVGVLAAVWLWQQITKK